MNFAKFRRSVKGFKKTTANTQVAGFTDDDTYNDVIVKAARSLGIECDMSELSLICSSGLVPDLPLCGQPWKLGEYVMHVGGSANRSKKLWGIFVPIDADDKISSIVLWIL